MTLFSAGEIADKVGQMVINGLAVAGSAAVGYFLTFGLIWLICRLTIQRQPPKAVTKILSLIGAILGGILAAMLLFGDGAGGGGFGLGGGLGLGRGPNAA